MGSENFANAYQTTLNGAITSGATSLTVASATGAPAVPFRVKIGTELLLVTAATGPVYTVTRGVEGTTAASHADTSTVTHLVTAAGLASLGVQKFVFDIPLATLQAAGAVSTATFTSGALPAGAYPLNAWLTVVDGLTAVGLTDALIGNSNKITVGSIDMQPVNGDVSAVQGVTDPQPMYVNGGFGTWGAGGTPLQYPGSAGGGTIAVPITITGANFADLTAGHIQIVILAVVNPPSTNL